MPGLVPVARKFKHGTNAQSPTTMFHIFLISVLLCFLLQSSIVQAASDLSTSERQRPSLLDLDGPLICDDRCNLATIRTGGRIMRPTCTRPGCFPTRCMVGQHPGWKCALSTNTCKASSKISKRTIQAGCKGCSDRTVMFFGYLWPQKPVCLNKCMKRKLETVCKRKGLTKKDIAVTYRMCCRSCKGEAFKNECSCFIRNGCGEVESEFIFN